MDLLTAALIAASVINALAFGALGLRHRRLEQQAITDPLTGVFNRRYMDRCLTTAIERHKRLAEPASLLFFDVDHFKAINDEFGHSAGDRVLRALARLVTGRMRKLDTLFRVGGEEFVLLLAGARYASALAVAEDIRMKVAAAALLKERTVSISVGVAELRSGQSTATWMRNADAALHHAKRSGRNRVSGMPAETPAQMNASSARANATYFPGAMPIRQQR